MKNKLETSNIHIIYPDIDKMDNIDKFNNDSILLKLHGRYSNKFGDFEIKKDNQGDYLIFNGKVLYGKALHGNDNNLDNEISISNSIRSNIDMIDDFNILKFHQDMKTGNVYTIGLLNGVKLIVYKNNKKLNDIDLRGKYNYVDISLDIITNDVGDHLILTHIDKCKGYDGGVLFFEDTILRQGLLGISNTKNKIELQYNSIYYNGKDIKFEMYPNIITDQFYDKINSLRGFINNNGDYLVTYGYKKSNKDLVKGNDLYNDFSYKIISNITGGDVTFNYSENMVNYIAKSGVSFDNIKTTIYESDINKINSNNTLIDSSDMKVVFNNNIFLDNKSSIIYLPCRDKNGEFNILGINKENYNVNKGILSRNNIINDNEFLLGSNELSHIMNYDFFKCRDHLLKISNISDGIIKGGYLLNCFYIDSGKIYLGADGMTDKFIKDIDNINKGLFGSTINAGRVKDGVLEVLKNSDKTNLLSNNLNLLDFSYDSDVLDFLKYKGTVLEFFKENKNKYKGNTLYGEVEYNDLKDIKKQKQRNLRSETHGDNFYIGDVKKTTNGDTFIFLGNGRRLHDSILYHKINNGEGYFNYFGYSYEYWNNLKSKDKNKYYQIEQSFDFETTKILQLSNGTNIVYGKNLLEINGKSYIIKEFENIFSNIIMKYDKIINSEFIDKGKEGNYTIRVGDIEIITTNDQLMNNSLIIHFKGISVTVNDISSGSFGKREQEDIYFTLNNI